MRASQVSQIGPLYDMSPPAYRRRPTLPMSPTSEEHLRTRSEAVGVRLRQTQSNCRPKCLCACHTQQRSATPSFMKQALGQLFVGYAGLPVLGNKCDSSACERGQIPSINVEYWFPLGLLVPNHPTAACISDQYWPIVPNKYFEEGTGLGSECELFFERQYRWIKKTS